MITRNVDKFEYKYNYSFCTLVNDNVEYENFLTSCKQKGFDNKNSEFLYIDNSIVNKYDAYSGINKLISHSQGKYIILCHQDIRFVFDGMTELENIIDKIDKIDKIDSRWGCLGNAGAGGWNSEISIRITDPHGDNKSRGIFPVRVSSLDENFIILKNGLNVGLSTDLNGFHLYGLDICLQSYLKGNTCYVVDFHLKHLSAGNSLTSEFFQCKNNIINSYNKKFTDKYIKTTSTMIFLSKNKFKSNIFNINSLRKYLNFLIKLTGIK